MYYNIIFDSPYALCLIKANPIFPHDFKNPSLPRCGEIENANTFAFGGINSFTPIKFCGNRKPEYVATALYVGIVLPRSPITTNKKTKHNHNTPPP